MLAYEGEPSKNPPPWPQPPWPQLALTGPPRFAKGVFGAGRASQKSCRCLPGTPEVQSKTGEPGAGGELGRQSWLYEGLLRSRGLCLEVWLGHSLPLHSSLLAPTHPIPRQRWQPSPQGVGGGPGSRENNPNLHLHPVVCCLQECDPFNSLLLVTPKKKGGTRRKISPR